MMSKVDRDTLLKQRGKVMRYWDFVKDTSLNETSNWRVAKDSITVEPDVECIKASWNIICQEATTYDEMVRYLSERGNVEVGLQAVIEHIMDIVDAHLNREVILTSEENTILNLEQFIEKTSKLDYSMTVEILVRKLVGNIVGEPDYRKIIRDIVWKETRANPDANLQILELVKDEEEEETEEAEEAEKVGEQ